MKIFTARAKRGKLKYYEEHVSFTMDGSDKYNWRIVQNEIKDCSDLSLPDELVFLTSKCKFNELDSYDWVKSDFKIPIFHNKLIEILKTLGDTNYRVYPITIKDSKNEKRINNNFSAVYINNYIDCIDRENSNPLKSLKTLSYDYRHTIFKENFEYPVIFKIKDISTPYMHFATEDNINKLAKYGATGFDFEDVSKIK